ncbi:MAG: YceI family protein [bacterium]|nr:YceI family protein [bacterium]
MRLAATALFFLIVLPPMAGGAAEDETIFGSADHCVAYQTIKDMWFVVDTGIVGKSCEVEASLTSTPDDVAPRISVSLPIESLDSNNRFRDGAVADLLGAEEQPEIRFLSSPLEAETLRQALPSGRFELAGVLSFGGKDFQVAFPVEIIQGNDRHYAKGVLASSFTAFAVEVPTIAGGLIARPKDALDLAFQLELERVDGLEAWAESAGLSADAEE